MSGGDRAPGELSPSPDAFLGADRRSGPGLWGVERLYPSRGVLSASLSFGVGARSAGSLGQGQCGRRAGVGRAAGAWDRRREAGGPRRSAGRGAGLGTGQGARGGPQESQEMFVGHLGETLPLGQGSLLLPRPAKVADFTAELKGKQAGLAGKKGDREDPSGRGPEMNECACGEPWGMMCGRCHASV
ncbi:hypothetical protein PAL_GLEAN10010343 [Pteropus alecto]|uniref:Uncharacterized protein n=1 Tax=Pteropus alecto TaxID=9402 RepID=L5KJ23_PTEAL|nr:hypothetical protein PAL_GLEAN10010343 [Pteropus alecto]